VPMHRSMRFFIPRSLRLGSGILFTLVVAFASAPGVSAATVVHTRIQAERNILHAHRVLRRLDRRLVNARTGLPRTDTVVVCRGEGRRHGSGWPRFVCEISFRRAHVRVRYLAQRRNGFELHRLRKVG
jgi:hypothetical protein